MAKKPVVFIGSKCIIRNNGRFFLLSEIEAKVPGVEIDPIIIIRITKNQAMKLNKAGIKFCPIRNTRPKPAKGQKVEFKCVFQDQCNAFEVFDVENATDEAVLVRISLEKACRLVSKGARRCTVIRRPFLEA